MREAFNEVMLQLRAAWRFRWVAMAAAWILAVLLWAVITILPDKFEASAKVFVDTDSVLRPLLKGLAVQSDLEQRLAVMTRTLLTRSNLEKVIREADLDYTVKTEVEREQLIGQLAAEIDVSGGRRQNLYTISYSHANPTTAKKVVETLLSIFVETALGDTRQDTDAAQRFLDQQIKEYEARLVEAENRLMGFKRKHVKTLPDQGGGIFQRLQSAQEQFQKSALELNEARQRRDALRRQLREAENLQSQPIHAGRELTPTESRLLSLQTQLDSMLLRYTEAHPDVKELRTTIADLERQRKEELANPQGNKKVVNVVYEQIKLALSQAEAEYAALQVRVAAYKHKVDELNRQLEVLPKVETELKRLNRDYEVNKTNYDALVASRESAKISEHAEAAGDDIKFKVIEPPRLPIIPSAPNRPLLLTMALILALGIGAVIAFVLSQLRPVVYTKDNLQRISSYPVFGTVSRIWTDQLRMKRRMEIGGLAVVCLLLVGLFTIVILFNEGLLAQELLRSVRVES